MNPLRLGIILFSLATALSACGGGSGTKTVPPPSPSLITYDTMVSEVSAIVQASDRLMMTDLLFAHPNTPEGNRFQTSCGLGQCQASLYGLYSLGISKADFEFADRTDDHRFFTGSGGVKMADVRGRYEEAGLATDFKNLGGWLDYNAFAVESSRIVSAVSDGVDLAGTVFNWAYSIGDATGTTPAFGNATWTGTMVGSDTSSLANRSNRVRGDATLSFNLSRSDIDVAFTNIHDIDAEHRYDNITWQNVPVAAGHFAIFAERLRPEIARDFIDGRFYGPNHEEAGGIFESNNIVGAFGAKR